jgi:large subunit ribosomal protein L31
VAGLPGESKACVLQNVSITCRQKLLASAIAARHKQHTTYQPVVLNFCRLLLYNVLHEHLHLETDMKPDIHPAYRPVLFHDTAADVFFLIGSTVDTDRTQQHTDGNTYPYVALDVSSASHPMYTGQQRKTTTEGRIAGFNKRFATFGSGGKKDSSAAE